MRTFTHKLSNDGSTLTAYVHDLSKEMPNVDIRPAILVIPGGAYMFCSDREADPVALAYLAEGYNTFILRYSVGVGIPATNAFDDAEEAMSYLYANAGELNIAKEKIAVIGFSAGGHLAAWLSTYGTVKPAATILGYACILPEIGNLLGKELPDLCGKVNAATPPAFIFTTRNDPVVPVRHSLMYARALDVTNVPFEMHIFGDGAHGLSLAKTFTASGKASMVNADMAQWFDLSLNWLKGVLGDYQVREEDPKINDEALGPDSPLGALMGNDKTRAAVLEVLPQISDIIRQAEENGQTGLLFAAPIREIAKLRPELLNADKVYLLGELLARSAEREESEVRSQESEVRSQESE